MPVRMKRFSFLFLLVWLSGSMSVACEGSKDSPAPAPVQAPAKAAAPEVVAAPPPRAWKLAVPVEAVGWGQLAPADFAAAAATWTGDGKIPVPAQPVGLAVFVTDTGALEVAFLAPKGSPVGGAHTRCHPAGGACWWTREGFVIGAELRERSYTASGSFFTVSLAHPRAAAFVEARPLLKSLELGELTWRVAAGRVELEARPLAKKLSRTLVDAAHYWLMLAINERAAFLQASSVGAKFFDALPGASLGVKKNTIHFAMAGDCSMLAWSLQAMHQLYPYLHP